jgi:tRNA A-37 threonylcarbamoyl transferase component Bud32
MKFLQNKITKDRFFPIVLHHLTGNNKSPSGKIFKELIVMNKIDGRVHSEYHSGTNYINLKHESIDDKKKILTSLMNIISLLHSFDIIYGDTFDKNVIISNTCQPFLIDFGNSFFKDKVPEIWSSAIIDRPISIDIFCLQSLMGDLLDNYVDKDDKTTEISHLLETLNNH